MTEHEQPAATTAVAYTVEQIHVTIDRLRESWEWLLLLVEPGRSASTRSSATTDDQLERLEAIGHSDRAYRAWNLRHGMSALPPSPAAARVAVLDAQAVVAAQVDTAVHLAASALQVSYVGAQPSVAESVRAGLRWLAGGAGRPAVLDEIRDERVAATIDKILQRADRTARAAAQCPDEEPGEALTERCPACGQRSLQREENRMVRCVSKRCVCTGDASPEQPACGCGQKPRRPGTTHVWLPSQLDGPYGLWAAVAAVARSRPSVRRGASGHGGWQSRGMAGMQ